VETVRQEILPGSQLLKVLELWDNPGEELEEGTQGSLWHLNQAYTNVLTTRGVDMGFPERTMKLYRLMDETCNLSLSL